MNRANKIHPRCLRPLLSMLVWTLCAAALSAPASAQTITSRNTTTPYPGVRLVQGRTSSPSTRFWAAYIDLCNDYIHVDATSSTTSARSAGSWANSVGAQLAVNGDFYAYTNGVLHTYGDAVGGGVRWPSIRTGRDASYSSGWFYQDYGWIAFGKDWVNFSNTKDVKQRQSTYGTTQGWKPGTVTTSIPEGTEALVSGFPQLVIEGQRYTCSSPTASSCFPKRTDMRARHPRTAMGLSEDRQTFILVTVDGRSSVSAGMYGAELAKLMDDLGAWVAFNLDGGGSTQMWMSGQGTVNSPSGGSPRAVLNHWGIFAGTAGGKSRIPGSCDRSRDEVLYQAHLWNKPTSSDVNGDGKADVCARGPDGVECFLADGAGLSTRVEGPALDDGSGWGDSDNYTSIRMGDVNADGLADLCARANARVYCWLSDGAGFPTRIDGPELSDAAGYDQIQYLSTLRLADFNGDGRADICVRSPTEFRCYPSTGDGFGPAVLGPALKDDSGWDQPRNYGTIRMADVNGDGKADVCARANARVYCWLSDGAGFPTRIDGPAWSNDTWDHVRYWSSIRLADLNNDGRADLCGRDAEGVKCHLSEGDGFGPEIAGPALTDASGWHDYSNYSTLRLADVDGDKYLDLCIRANAGMRCYLWNGAGFSNRIDAGMLDENGWDNPHYFRTIQFADVNGDGKEDLCGRASARYYCWLSDGDGFPTRVDGPLWSNANDWTDIKYYSTIRLGGARALPDAPDPGEDVGYPEDVGYAEDVDRPDTLASDVGSDAAGRDTGSAGDSDTGSGRDDASGEDARARASTSSCACQSSGGAPPLGGAFVGLVLIAWVGVRRRGG